MRQLLGRLEDRVQDANVDWLLLKLENYKV